MTDYKKRGKTNRAKGHAFERFVANKLRPIFPNVKRELESQGGDGVDLANTGELRFQCKAYKDYAPISKIQEIQREGIPILVTKGDRKEPMAVMPLDALLAMLGMIQELDDKLTLISKRVNML